MRCVWSFGKIATRRMRDGAAIAQAHRPEQPETGQHRPVECTHALHLGTPGFVGRKKEMHQSWRGNWKVALLCGFSLPRLWNKFGSSSGCCTCPPCTRGVLAESGRDSRCREDLRQDERLGKQAKSFRSLHRSKTLGVSERGLDEKERKEAPIVSRGLLSRTFSVGWSAVFSGGQVPF